MSRRLLKVVVGEVQGTGEGDSSRREHKHTDTRAEEGVPLAGAAGGFDGKQTNLTAAAVAPPCRHGRSGFATAAARVACPTAPDAGAQRPSRRA